MCALFIYIYFYLKQLFIFSSDNHLIYEYVMSVLYYPVPPLIILMIFTSFDIYKVNPKFRFSQHLYTISSPLVLTSPPSLLLLLYFPSSPFLSANPPLSFAFSTPHVERAGIILLMCNGSAQSKQWGWQRMMIERELSKKKKKLKSQLILSKLIIVVKFPS